MKSPPPKKKAKENVTKCQIPCLSYLLQFLEITCSINDDNQQCKRVCREISKLFLFLQQHIPFPDRKKISLMLKELRTNFFFHSRNRFPWLNSSGGNGSVDSLLHPTVPTSVKSQEARLLLEYIALSMDNI